LTVTQLANPRIRPEYSNIFFDLAMGCFEPVGAESWVRANHGSFAGMAAVSCTLPAT